MSKKCTPLWREARFEVKMYKAHHVRTPFGSCEKVHTVAARSTFPSQNVQNTPWKKHVKTPHARTTFGRSDVVLRGRRRAQGILHVVKSEQIVKVL